MVQREKHWGFLKYSLNEVISLHLPSNCEDNWKIIPSGVKVSLLLEAVGGPFVLQQLVVG